MQLNSVPCTWVSHVQEAIVTHTHTHTSVGVILFQGCQWRNQRDKVTQWLLQDIRPRLHTADIKLVFLTSFCVCTDKEERMGTDQRQNDIILGENKHYVNVHQAHIHADQKCSHQFTCMVWLQRPITWTVDRHCCFYVDNQHNMRLHKFQLSMVSKASHINSYHVHYITTEIQYMHCISQCYAHLGIIAEGGGNEFSKKKKLFSSVPISGQVLVKVF